MASNPAALVNLAVEASKNLEALATGLAQAGADDGTVQAVTKMADVARKLTKALGQAAQAAPAPGQETMQSASEGLAQDARAQEAPQGGMPA